MNEARRLGTCTDTLTRRGEKWFVSTFQYSYDLVGFSVLPRSINIKSACAAFSIFVCMCAAGASINTRKALNCKAPSGTSPMEERYHNIYLHWGKFCLHTGALSSLPLGQSPASGSKHTPPSFHVMASGPTQWCAIVLDRITLRAEKINKWIDTKRK